MSLFGMDTSEILSVAKNLGSQAGDLQQLVADVDALVKEAVSVWEGDDARQFLDWWETDHKKALMEAQRLLDRLSGVAHAGVSAQERASSA